MLRLEHAGGEPVERVVVLAEQPGERHAVQAPGVAGGRRVAVHVRVDPHQAERLPAACAPRRSRCRRRSCGRRRSRRAAGRARRASATAAASWPHSRLTANCLRRSPGSGSRIGPASASAPHSAQALREQRNEHGRRFRAARIGAAEAPGRADQLDLSLHRYILFSAATPTYERRPQRCVQCRALVQRVKDDGIDAEDGRTGRASRSGCGSPCRRGSSGYAEHQAATANAIFVGLALALGSHFECVACDEAPAEWLNLAVGVWLVCAPFMLELQRSRVATANSIVVGSFGRRARGVRAVARQADRQALA